MDNKHTARLALSANTLATVFGRVRTVPINATGRGLSKNQKDRRTLQKDRSKKGSERNNGLCQDGNPEKHVGVGQRQKGAHSVAETAE